MTSKACFFAICGAFCASSAALAVAPFSNYGNIQNVQNYSSNPFWNPNGPYNQRMPQAVYVQGPDVNTGDCQRTVFALITSECATRNNCIDVSIGDVRPTIMVQLSRLPGHNYATACAGFIDTSFDEYKSKYANAGNMRTTGFPTAAAKNTTVTTGNNFTIKNPYEIKTAKWEQDMKDREAELKSARASGTASFPTTINDYSFTERMQNLATGYEPYKDKSAYATPEWNVELYKDYLTRMKDEQTEQMAIDKNAMSQEDYCKKYPGDFYCRKDTTTTPADKQMQNNTTNNNNLATTIVKTEPDEVVFRI